MAIIANIIYMNNCVGNEQTYSDETTKLNEFHLIPSLTKQLPGFLGP